MGVRFHVDLDGEPVAADNPCWRMQDDGVTNFPPFRIQCLLYPQWPTVLVAGKDRRIVAPLKLHRQSRLPTGGGLM